VRSICPCCCAKPTDQDLSDASQEELFPWTTGCCRLVTMQAGCSVFFEKKRSAVVRFSEAFRLLAKHHLVDEMPIRFDNFWIFGGPSTCDLHFRPELRERGG
jgi:hypothetical protein